ncbi:MAG: TraB/GumN family protein [Erythrobacter sp.]|jgi:uncharacterized protein YbaP (TraB family)|nr:TraB/GumN family protein [Erythrobacter sp.]
MNLASVLATTTAALALFAGTPALADAHMDTADAAVAVEADLPAGPEGPALWKVADEDTTIYLFGTVHVLPADTKWYDVEIAEALAASDTVVTELKMTPEAEAALQQLSMQRGMIEGGGTLRALLNEEQNAAYEAALAGLGVPVGAFDPFEPWLAGLTLTMLPVLQQGYDLNSGVDKVILSKAGALPQDALETAEFQLGIFDGLDEAKQIEFLMSAVEGVDEAKATLDEMVSEWIAGDADALAETMNEAMEDPELAEALLYTRNANWADWIDTRLDTTPGTVFMAVGAGHLAGERSVQDYLAERDIEVVRVQ